MSTLGGSTCKQRIDNSTKEEDWTFESEFEINET